MKLMEDDTMNINLLNFYESAEKSELVDKINFIHSNDTSCLVLFEQVESERIVGISNKGDWLLKINAEYCLLTEKLSLFKLINLLEVSFTEIENQIYKRFEHFIQDYDIKIIFPFYEIVEYVFLYVPSIYWFELAYDWFDMLTINQKKELIPKLQEIATNKKLSQRLRQKIRKDLKNIGTA